MNKGDYDSSMRLKLPATFSMRIVIAILILKVAVQAEANKERQKQSQPQLDKGKVMTAVRKPFYTIEEYLALEKSSEEKYEYWDGQVFCMSGGSQAHTDISDNVFRLLSNQLVDRNCRAMSGAMPIKTFLAPPYKYPDGSVACGKREFEKIDGIAVLTNPILIVEVLSPSTERIDRGPKFTLYKNIASFKEYLLIAQDEPEIIQFVKQDDGEWEAKQVNGFDSRLYLPTIDCTLELSQVYQDVEFGY